MGTDKDMGSDNQDASPLNRQSELKGWMQVVIVFGLLALGVVGNFILSSSASKPRMRIAGAESLFVEVIIPTVEDTRVRLVETGVVQARSSISLSPLVSGRVVWVSPNLASGGYFKTGESLFRLDNEDYVSAVNKARADLAKAEADLRVERAEAQVAREEWDITNPGEPIPPLVAREPQISQAEASVQSANAALRDAELNLSRVDFSLPFDGRIVSTTVGLGQNLSAGQAYGEAYDIQSIEISTPLPADALRALEPAAGRSAEIRLPGPGPDQTGEREIYAATVVRADAELNQETRLGRVILTFNGQTQFLPGTFVDVTIEGPLIEQAHLIPERAISQDRVVWVAEEERLASRRPRLFFAKDGEVVTAPFDWADGVIITPLVDPIEGTKVTLSNTQDVTP